MCNGFRSGNFSSNMLLMRSLLKCIAVCTFKGILMAGTQKGATRIASGLGVVLL